MNLLGCTRNAQDYQSCYSRQSRPSWITSCSKQTTKQQSTAGILCTLTTPSIISDQLTHYSKGDMNWLTHPGCFKRDFDDFMVYEISLD